MRTTEELYDRLHALETKQIVLPAASVECHEEGELEALSYIEEYDPSDAMVRHEIQGIKDILEHGDFTKDLTEKWINEGRLRGLKWYLGAD